MTDKHDIHLYHYYVLTTAVLSNPTASNIAGTDIVRRQLYDQARANHNEATRNQHRTTAKVFWFNYEQYGDTGALWEALTSIKYVAPDGNTVVALQELTPHELACWIQRWKEYAARHEVHLDTLKRQAEAIDEATGLYVGLRLQMKLAQAVQAAQAEASEAVTDPNINIPGLQELVEQKE